MEEQAPGINPDLMRLVARHSSWPAERIRPSTHLVHDLRITGEEITLFVDDVEQQFDFVGTAEEWESVNCLADLDALVAGLRGQHRAEAVVEKERDRLRVRRQSFQVIAAFVAWLLLGVASRYFFFPEVSLFWVAATASAVLAHSIYRKCLTIRERRRWFERRLERFGV